MATTNSLPPAPLPDAAPAPPAPATGPQPSRAPGSTAGGGAGIAETASGTKKYLSVFNIALMTMVTVMSLRALPPMATYGLGSVLMWIVPAVVFLVPTALVGAELATTWEGGVYVWVREAMSNRLGFVAVWLQWIQNVVWYPTQLAFVAAAFAFMVGLPGLSDSGMFTAVVILVVYWIATLVTLRGGNLFAKLSTWGGVVGTLVPGALLLVLGGLWLAGGNPSQTPLQADRLIPPFAGIGSVVLVVSNVLAYAGMEVNAVHAGQMKDPRRGYSKAMALSFALILAVCVLPTIAVSIAVPAKELGFTNGIFAAFQIYLDHWHAGWLAHVVAGAIALGAVASVITWVAGPSTGLLAAARTGLLPPFLQKRNKHGVQEGILAVQGLVVSALALLFVLIPDVSSAFIALVDMAAALYIVMYLLMFASAIILRRKQPNADRGYRVPAMGLVAGVGFAACVLALIMAFIPPAGHSVIGPSVYPWLVAAVVVGLGAPPLAFYALRRPAWDRR
jgi:putative glutamate/gamma-aminobutyrate antiporter